MLFYLRRKGEKVFFFWGGEDCRMVALSFFSKASVTSEGEG